MTAPLFIRNAEPGDAAAVAAIYNEGIGERVATFETRPRSERDIRAWFDAAPLIDPDGRAISAPFLVAAVEAAVIGWIHAGAYRAGRAAYAGIADYSVYVAASARGRGVGDALMRAFLPACEAAGYWKVVARIFPENRASLALAARHGFRVVGTYEAHARLDGVWRDVVIVERRLSGG